jgi:polyisoprenoid-binding protein YceI
LAWLAWMGAILIGCAPVAATEAPPVPPTLPASSPAPVAAPPSATVEAPVQPAAATAAATYRIDPSQSEARYEVGETFFEGNRFATAIGRTRGVTGDITLDASNPAASRLGPISIDVSTLKSDQARRDNFLRGNGLQTGRFPTVMFTPTALEGLPSSVETGVPITFQVTGDLLVREVSRPVTFQVTAQLDGTSLRGSATSQVLMSDFGLGPIKLAFLQTEDLVLLVFEFVALPAAG